GGHLRQPGGALQGRRQPLSQRFQPDAAAVDGRGAEAGHAGGLERAARQPDHPAHRDQPRLRRGRQHDGLDRPARHQRGAAPRRRHARLKDPPKMQALRTAATGMATQQLNVEVISNNIANMNTVGFKKQSAVFEDLLYQTLEQPGAQSSDQGNVVPTGVQIGAGVKAGSVYRITGQGTLTNTGNALDLAINGP